MDQKKTRANKTLPTAMNQEMLRQVKGGYREVIGLDPGSTFVRWDEIDIRFDDEVGTFLGSGPQGGNGLVAGTPNPGSISMSKRRS